MTTTLAANAWMNPDTLVEGDVAIGFGSCVGLGDPTIPPTTLGHGVSIGAFCVVERGVVIDADVLVDHYCRISSGAHIGSKTKILYRAQVFDNVEVGRNCIIAGELVDRTIVGDDVTFQGNTAHGYKDPTLDWDDTEEPSPIIERGSVVGVGALIIGGLRIGPCAYVCAGEVVRSDVPEGALLKNGRLLSLAQFRGTIKARCL